MTETRKAAVFDPEFLGDLRYWVGNDRKIALRILDSEPLRHELAQCWSRRVDLQNRLVYRVKMDSIDFLQARLHY